MAIRYVETKPAKRAMKPKELRASKGAPRKPGRPLAPEAHLTAEAVRPWEAAGMSRRTWYRRKREDRDAAPAKLATSTKKL